MPVFLESDKMLYRDNHAHVKSHWNFDDTEYAWKKNVEAGRMLDRYSSPDSIFYNYNSLGYRADKELDQYNERQYVVSFGCSNTEGIGLNAEHTYCHLLGKEFGVESCNLGIAGASMNLVEAQIMQYVKLVLAQKLKKPFLVTVQWPEPHRYSFAHKEKDIRGNLGYSFYSHLPNIKEPDENSIASKMDNTWLNNRYNAYLEHQHVEVYSMIQRANMLLTYIASKVIHFTISGSHYQNNNLVINQNLLNNIPYGDDTEPPARDLCHPGIESNNRYATELIGMYYSAN